MPSVKSYRDLRIWQQSMDLVPAVYETLRRFPKEENYALADQIRRAALSIPANIAEGHARHHVREYRHFLFIARGSLAELDTLLELASRLGYIDSQSTTDFNSKIRSLRMSIQALINRLSETGT